MNNPEKSAGESRRSRRLALNIAALVVIALALLIVFDRGVAEKDDESWSVGDGSFQRSDAQIAEHLLQSVNSANPVLCAAVDRAFNNGHWGESLTLAIDDTPADANETARWIGKRRIDSSVLPIARRALSSADPCTRRVGARIAGYIDVKRLDEELRTEIQSSSVPTRVAAIMALGYAEQHEALPMLEQLVKESEPTVRYSALWALGSLENQSTVRILVPLLENDRDAEVRRLAAWALGRLDD